MYRVQSDLFGEAMGKAAEEGAEDRRGGITNRRFEVEAAFAELVEQVLHERHGAGGARRIQHGKSVPELGLDQRGVHRGAGQDARPRGGLLGPRQHPRAFDNEHVRRFFFGGRGGSKAFVVVLAAGSSAAAVASAAVHHARLLFPVPAVRDGPREVFDEAKKAHHRTIVQAHNQKRRDATDDLLEMFFL